MILFIFEGGQREPYLYESTKRLFIGDMQEVICKFNQNIYTFYRDLMAMGDGGELVPMLKMQGKLDSTIRDSDISEIYLFFDIEMQHHKYTNEQKCEIVAQLLDYFDDETGNGKLYINYPMIDSIRHHKELPDADYPTYRYPIADCKQYKQYVSRFSAYPTYDHICVNERGWANERVVAQVRQKWHHLVRMNVSKAILLSGGSDAAGRDAGMEAGRDDEKEGGADVIRYDQRAIFSGERDRHILTDGHISILNSFPLFLADYLGRSAFDLP